MGARKHRGTLGCSSKLVQMTHIHKSASRTITHNSSETDLIQHSVIKNNYYTLDLKKTPFTVRYRAIQFCSISVLKHMLYFLVQKNVFAHF